MARSLMVQGNAGAMDSEAQHQSLFDTSDGEAPARRGDAPLAGVSAWAARAAVLALALVLCLIALARYSVAPETTTVGPWSGALPMDIQLSVQVCKAGTKACGGLCLPAAAGSVCCPSPRGDAVLCSSESECCDGVCMSKGTGCAKECAPGLIPCGGRCLPGTDRDICCEGPLGDGILCDLESACCDGVCAAPGTGCDVPCLPGMIRCGGECLVGDNTSACCVGPLGTGIVCAKGAECCSGVCLDKGLGCAEDCAPGMMRCGGQCLAAEEGASCCEGKAGNGIICLGGDECCDGVCMAKGTGCAKNCGPGMVKCGGECLPANSSHSCCVGPTGTGIVCDAHAECCDGVCVSDGELCADKCKPGMIKCGGVCMYGSDDAKCCVGPTGSGIVCEADAECCDGVCAAAGQGCASKCRKGTVSCGGACLPASVDSVCCLGPSGKGSLCAGGDQCCHGVCTSDGTSCDTKCNPGSTRCGGECLPGAEGATCCEGPTGSGILCNAGDHCCAGVCVAGGTGCDPHCGNGTVSCGGVCLPGNKADECCLGPTGLGSLCGEGTQCCDGRCAPENEGCAPNHCGKDFVKCGGECLPGNATSSKCCEGPTGAGILCEKSADCCGGLCQAKGSPCALMV